MPQAAKVLLLLDQKVAYLIIGGATASGKTDLALSLAGVLGGEIISADSRQLYRGLDAGTAKPRRDADGLVSGIPYHLVDCLEPAQAADAGLFVALARSAMDGVRGRGRVPIVAGGTGLYLKAITQGLDPMPRRDEALRKRLAAEASLKGKNALHQRLSQIDPRAALKIHPGNVQRVIRALEVCHLTGRPFSSFLGGGAGRSSGAPAFVIEWPAEILRARIESRARRMWPGILEEARGLSSRYSGAEPGFQSLGYPQAFACLRGTISSQSALEELIRLTCAYAKRQRTWFRHQLKAESIAGADVQTMLAQTLSHLSVRQVS